ncbi:MAG: 50S ribosomal protein L21 [Candidatus Marinimicrobia bacterium]|nr:50S ribosomal protein L21 [Candidatus Neomarinimicrobiota bacterium]
MYALIEIANKQFKVKKGDLLKIPYAGASEEGSSLEYSDVLMINNDKDVVFGAPYIENAKVTATVKEHGRDKKILVFKKKRRKGYKKTIGHRQNFTLLEINDIVVSK